MMDDTSHIEGCLHREVVRSSAANLLVVAHDAEFCLPELDVLLLTCFPNLHSDFSHVWDRGIGPVAMSTDEREELLGLAQIGLRTVLGEEGVDFVASLPVGHVGAKHAAIVARLIDENLGVELVFYQCFAYLLCHLGKLAVGGWGSFLLRSCPVPMSIRLVDRADVVEVDAIVLFDAFERCGDELSEFAVAIILQIDGAAAPCVGCESVLGIEHGC